MKRENGEIIICNGSKGEVRQLVHFLPVHYFRQGKRVLILDSINSINPHHRFFKDINQEDFFKSVYCARTPLPYDLWARLGTCKEFIIKNKIEILIISSLSIVFKEYDINEVAPMVYNILKRAEGIAKETKIISFIGNSNISDESAELAFNILVKEKNAVEVQNGPYCVPAKMGDI